MFLIKIATQKWKNYKHLVVPKVRSLSRIIFFALLWPVFTFAANDFLLEDIPCSHCRHMFETLQQIAPKAQAYYKHITHVLSDDFLQRTEALPQFVDGSHRIISEIEKVAALINKLTSFNFTSRRQCKIGDDFGAESTIMSLIEKIELIMTDELDAQHVDVDVTDELDWRTTLMPSIALGSQISTLCVDYSSKLDMYYNERVMLLSTLYSFFHSIEHSVSIILDVTKEQHLCNNCDSSKRNFGFVNNTDFRQILNDIADAIVQLKRIRSENADQTLQQTIELRKRIPLLTSDGRRIAIIPEYQYEFFIEDDGAFLYKDVETYWDKESASRKSRIKYTALEIEDGFIVSPERLKGYHAPVFAFVSFDNVSSLTDKHMQPIFGILEKLSESFDMTECLNKMLRH
ncbi:MAG: hypothetical protein LBQ43_04200 [Holosporales bacterium]|jgi:hypothetical protein|nr:hypothetical protein [Holosporales bacterium]